MSEATPEPTPAEQYAGKHRIRFEPPDLLMLTYVGDIAPEEIRMIAETIEGTPVPRGALLMLIDAGQLGHVPVESRKALTAREGMVPHAGMAFINASFQTKIVLQLILGALRVLSRGEMGPIRFFTSEGDARAWLATRRRAP